MMAALLATLGVQAATVKKYLRLTDSFCWIDSKVQDEVELNSKDATTGAIHLEWNTKVGWTLPNKDLSAYTSLVVNLKSPAEKDLFVFLNDEGTFWPWEKNSKSVLAAGETTISITLSDLTHNVDGGDGSALNLENVVGITLFNQNANYAACDYVLESVYLEKETTAEDVYTTPFDFSNLTYKADNTSFNTDTYTFSFTGGSYGGWQWETPQDWSAYKYLVVVPQNQWNTGSIFCSYVLEDNASHVIDDAVLRWGEWNMARAAVLDLTTVKTTYFESGKVDNVDTYMDFDIKNITKFYFRPIWGGTGDFGVAAIYLTNTAPIFGNNHDGASGTANLVRAYTEKDQWGTICLPYSAAVCGAEVYDVVGVDKLDNPSALYLERVFGILEAGKAYVFKNTADNANDFKLANVTFYSAGENEVAEASNTNLVGTFNGATVPNDGHSYILVGTQWKKVVGNNTIAANRAYLSLTESLVVPTAPARAITMNLVGGSETTVIENVNGLRKLNTAVYDLSGRRIMKDQLQRGVYVKDGKKVFVTK